MSLMRAVFNRSRPGLLVLLLGLVAAVPVAAQNYQGRELVKAELVANTSVAVPGKKFEAGLLLHIVPGWHTYWKYSGDAGIPIELKWQLPPGWKVGELHWPVPNKFNDPGDITTYGYHDEVLVYQELTPPDSLGDQPVKLAAEANWLVCEKICIPGSASLALELPVGREEKPKNADLFQKYRALLPTDLPGDITLKWEKESGGLLLRAQGASFARHRVVDFYPAPAGKVVVDHPTVVSHTADEVTVRVPLESGGQGAASLAGLLVYGDQEDGSDHAGWSIGEGAASSAAAGAMATPQRSGLALYLFFGFIGGLILNLMPCVLPVISLKIFGFVQHAGQSRGKILRSGLWFTAGIFAWFVGLGIVLILLRRAGHQITWALQFTNPNFVLVMSVVVLVFALNLFGVFEISLPQSWNRGLLGLTAEEGTGASFFQGVFATVLATPCSAPFLGTALGFAFVQRAPVIMAMFLAIAAGMSLPYILLCAQPGWLKFLPRPGPWMVRVKQLMGFLLLATLLFLLYVLGAQRGAEGVAWSGSFLLVVALVCWMQGSFMTPAARPVHRVITIVVMILLLIGGGIYFVGQKFSETKAALIAGNTPGDWQAFTPERLQGEIDQGHTVFVDFTAAWCITCKFNEASVLESDAVRQAFRTHEVTTLKADWTNGDPVITKLLQHFGRPGVPLYVLYPGKAGEPIVFPELLTKGIVLEKLESLNRKIAAE